MRKSELSKWGLNELCCKRTVHRWNRLELNFPLMYGTGTLQREQKFPVRGALYSKFVFICHESDHCQKENWLCRLQSTRLYKAYLIA